MFVFAQVSDLHIGQDRRDGGERAARRAARVMAYLNDLPVTLDALLVTGDIADHGLLEEYRLAGKILSTRHPVLTCPGNHDVRAAFRQGLLGESDGDGSAVNQVFRLPGATFAMCDSSISGRDDGRLDDETIGWLDSVLAESGSAVPAFVCFHHPPLTLHVPFIDRIRQFGEDRLTEVLRRHPQMVAVLCGHAHTPAASTFAGLPVLVAPGVVSTLKAPWEGETILDYELPPMIAFHVLDDERRLTTHFRVVY